MEAVLKEIFVYFFFLLIIFFISYQQRDPLSYQMSSTVRNVFLSKFETVSFVHVTEKPVCLPISSVKYINNAQFSIGLHKCFSFTFIYFQCMIVALFILSVFKGYMRFRFKIYIFIVYVLILSRAKVLYKINELNALR